MARLETLVVIEKTTGESYVINAHDFDPQRYRLPGEVVPVADPPATAPVAIPTGDHGTGIALAPQADAPTPEPVQEPKAQAKPVAKPQGKK